MWFFFIVRSRWIMTEAPWKMLETPNDDWEGTWFFSTPGVDRYEISGDGVAPNSPWGFYDSSCPFLNGQQIRYPPSSDWKPQQNVVLSPPYLKPRWSHICVVSLVNHGFWVVFNSHCLGYQRFISGARGSKPSPLRKSGLKALLRQALSWT